VIRDVLGTGHGAKPLANLDVFCVAPLDTPAKTIPPGIIPPKKLLHGVVAGVRDYGNRMGIPTIAGAVAFHPGYLGNPLVFCGTVGIMPRDLQMVVLNPVISWLLPVAEQAVTAFMAQRSPALSFQAKVKTNREDRCRLVMLSMKKQSPISY